MDAEIMTKAEIRVMRIIHGLPDKKPGFTWRDFCNSPSAFLKTWPLGRAGRRLAFLLSRKQKTAARSGLVVARHAKLALEKMAQKIKSRGGDLARQFIGFVVLLGVWAARTISVVLPDVPLKRQRKLALESQLQIKI
ncbi:MAG: hypothetical protein KGJ54_09450 [Betaproteobacteria bacterium]|nr:hypothetical protein [Betaproteobacteria bacterium]